MAHILIVAKGAYGDLFPIYSVALALQREGHKLTFATDMYNLAAATELGLNATALDRHDSSLKRRYSRGPIDLIYSWATNGSRYYRAFRRDAIENEYRNLLPLARKADLIIGNQQAYTAAIVREELDKPWVYCVASPIALLSSHGQPALFPGVQRLQALSMESDMLQRFSIWMGRTLSRILMYNFTQKRQRLGLSSKRHPAFEAMYSEQLNLLLASPTLFSPEQVWPDMTHIAGYTWFEAPFMNDAETTAKLRVFLEAGPRPVVFTLGGNRRINPGTYFHESIEACRLLGLRCVIVASKRFHDTLPQNENVLPISYLPYSTLFKHAAAVVHSGGIGTIGLALRYAVPSLLVPFSLDQFDNVYRATRSGFARSLPARKYRAKNVARALEDLLNDEELRKRLQKNVPIVTTENGTEMACDAIKKLLPGS